MATLYLRDVPDDVREVLRERAQRSRRSLNALVVEELTIVARRPSNAEVADRLRRRERADGPVTEQILEARESDRR